MNIIYCRLETTDNKTKDFNFESTNKFKEEDYRLIFKSYLYMIYYFSTTSEMSSKDLDFYDLYSPPFLKAVFIFKVNDRFLKLNYTDLPLSYQLSNFYPDTGKSEIISSQSREIYNALTNDFNIESWNNYKTIYNFFLNDDNSDGLDDEGSLSISSYGEEYTSDYDDEGSLSLGSSSVNYDEGDEEAFSQNNFDKLSIKERRKLLETYKKDLEDALEIKKINKSIKKINTRIQYLSKIKKEIENFNIVIKEKESKRAGFSDIHWMSENLFTQMSSYIIKKKKYESDIDAYNQKIEKNAEDTLSIKPDNILKNKIVIPTFLVAIITFILSWVMREQFWYLSGVSIPFFTISFYYLWGYIDYLEYIIKLRREKNFYEKKLVKIEKDFKSKFGNIESTLKQQKIEDPSIPIERFQELKDFDSELEDLQEKQQMFIVKNFPSEAQTEFDSLIKEKEDFNNTLKSFKDLTLNAKEIEYNIIELKKSIKEFEKQELDEFSLDDDLDDDIENDELTLDLSQVETKEYDFKYDIKMFNNYAIDLKEYFEGQDLNEVYNKVKKDFLDILDFSIHYNFSLDIDFNQNTFVFSSEKEIKWNSDYESKIKFFLQYALIKYLSKTKPTPVFFDIIEINKKFGVHFSSFLEEFSKNQLIYMD